MKRSNRKIGFLGTLLMGVFLWGGAFTSYAAQNPGVLDYVEGGQAAGWAWNAAAPEEAVEVKVVVTRQSDKTVAGEMTDLADSYREDLKNKGKGTGNYGFGVEIPWDTYGDGTYVVEAYANGQKLSGSIVHPVGEAAIAAAGSAQQELSNAGMKSLGIFRTTGYCPCYQCSEGWGRHTSTGAIASANHTIAVDPRVIPYGSKVMVNGVVYTAEDRGGGVKGNHIDIFFNTHQETLAHGSRKAEVFLIQ